MHIITNATGKVQGYSLDSGVQSAQNFIEITLAVVVGVNKRSH